MATPLPLRLAWATAVLGVALLARAAIAESLAGPNDVPALSAPADLSAYAGQPIVGVEVVAQPAAWFKQAPALRIQVGERFSVSAVRRVLAELLATGKFAGGRAEVEAVAGGVRLRFLVVPRRTVTLVRLRGPLESSDGLKQAVRVKAGEELVFEELEQIRTRVRQYYDSRGYPAVHVEVQVLDTDDQQQVALVVQVVVGAERVVRSRIFKLTPPYFEPELSAVLEAYPLGQGDRFDREALLVHDEQLERALVVRGWHQAKVEHEAQEDDLVVRVLLGPRARLAFEGNSTYDDEQLEAALEILEREDRQPESLRERLRTFYLKRGFLDAEVDLSLDQDRAGRQVAYRFRIFEGGPVRVVARQFPCLSGPKTEAELDSELDRFVSDALPGEATYASVASSTLDDIFGPKPRLGSRPPLYRLEPASVYTPELYERAMKHLVSLYRALGYLSVRVGPLSLRRAHCPAGSSPQGCVGRELARSACDIRGEAVPEQRASGSCQPDRRKGRFCSTNVTLVIPVEVGPQTRIYDIAFEGNRAFSEEVLARQVKVAVEEPASQAVVDEAVRNLLEFYAEQGYAFASVEAHLDVSGDQTRARVRFVIVERELVHVARIVIKGARSTNESLISGRVALVSGGLYRRSLVRQTEERLATLGVFSSVTVSFEDPEVFAREKVVVVEVVERKLQYLDIRPGFSTGEGFRAAFEYGHRNLSGEAIQLTLRSRVNYLPDTLIFEDDVRRKRPEGIAKQLERNNSIAIQFPEVGLGPLFGLGLEGIDIRDNARDYGLRKDAGLATLSYRPSRRFSAQLGWAIEFNDATIFFDGDDQTERQRLRDFIRDNPSQRDRFRVPEGETRALAERIGASWDRRDNPLEATSGTLISAEVEHVGVTPIGRRDGAQAAAATTDGDPFQPSRGNFFRITQRLAGYVRLSEGGLSLAMSLRGGIIVHLREASRTYPDRLFFLGGVDSLRGYAQDALIPEDVARRIVSGRAPGPSDLTLREVVIRGGDIFINPRAELRIPLSKSLKTAAFVDTGNLWTSPAEVTRAFGLRYTFGSGLRVATPIGPLAFDYGINAEQLLGSVLHVIENGRPYESFGAFHFSIGVF